jgi:hypothetical protein
VVLLRASLCAWIAATAGCSIALDPDQIDAQRLAAEVEVEVEVDEGLEAQDSVASDAADTTPPTDTTPPGDTGLVVDVQYQGQGGACTLDYKVAPITSCPETCPSGGWALVFDASGTAGTHTFVWRFSATDNYRIATRNLAGARVTVQVDVPTCELLAGAAVGPAKVLAELSVDGEAYDLVATLDFSVRQVTTCGLDSGDCAGP